MEANWLGVGVEHHGHTFNSEPNRDIRDNQSLRMHLRDAGWIIGASILIFLFFWGKETPSNMGLMPSCSNFYENIENAPKFSSGFSRTREVKISRI